VNNLRLKLIVGGVVGLLILLTFVLIFDTKRVRGNQVGVKEGWWSGVANEPFGPATYFIWPWESITVYDAGNQVFVMNDRTQAAGEKNKGRDMDSYLVQSSDSQDMHLNLMVQWRIDPAHVVQLHKMVVGDTIEEKVLRPVLLRVVKDHATVKKALDVYSGAGLVNLQQEIEKKLNEPDGELRQRGIIIDSFVIEHIKLDPEYVKEITARQVAVMKELRAAQEEKAALAMSLKAKAEARADYEKQVVEADRDAKVKVVAATAAAEQQVLAAEAEKKKSVLAAEAEKESGELKAQAILALGKANAESEKLKFSAYSAPGAEIYAKIQIADSMSKAFGNIKGYLPENMSIFTLGNNFQQAVENVMGGRAVPVPVAPGPAKK
jgi:regulator of protease activity HflC (stomatin/prohibitin superfamily)